MQIPVGDAFPPVCARNIAAAPAEPCESRGPETENKFKKELLKNTLEERGDKPASGGHCMEMHSVQTRQEDAQATPF